MSVLGADPPRSDERAADELFKIRLEHGLQTNRLAALNWSVKRLLPWGWFIGGFLLVVVHALAVAGYHRDVALALLTQAPLRATLLAGFAALAGPLVSLVAVLLASRCLLAIGDHHLSRAVSSGFAAIVIGFAARLFSRTALPWWSLLVFIACVAWVGWLAERFDEGSMDAPTGLIGFAFGALMLGWLYITVAPLMSQPYLPSTQVTAAGRTTTGWVVADEAGSTTLLTPSRDLITIPDRTITARRTCAPASAKPGALLTLQSPAMPLSPC